MSSIIKRALYFAAQKHEGQYRKGNRIPYIVHPVQVAFGVREYTDDEEIVAAALLHDTLEDCPDVSDNLLKKEFGERVGRIVNEVSLTRDKKYATWKEKKEAYLAKIKIASKEALIIVAVDKIMNLQGYFDALRENSSISEFGGTPNQYRWFYTEIGHILASKLKKHPIVKDYTKIWRLYKNKNL